MYTRLPPSFSTALAALLALAANVAHSQDSNIIDIPETVRAGYSLPLPIWAISSEGIYMTISWEIKDPNNTNATLSNNTFRATDTGTNTLTATITSGFPVTNFSASAVHTAAIQADGTLWTWGDNWVGQLGLGTWDAYYKEPIRIDTPSLIWATVSAGGYWEANYANYWDPYNHHYYTIALTTDGALWAWGDNRDGQLGIGDDQLQITTIPVPVLGDNDDWATVSAHTHTVALKTNGTLWAWGDNRDGQLGDGTTTSRGEPTPIVTPIGEVSNNWATVTAGFSCTMAIKTNGTLWAWGNNWAGQLGIGSRVNTNQPAQIGSDTDWLTVAPGFAHTAALKTNGTLWAWGYNVFGTNTLVDSNIPLQIDADDDWVAVAVGGDGDFDGGYVGEGIRNYTVALKADGTLWAWGDNTYGQLGDGTTDGHIKPKQIGTHTDWADISTTSVFVMASKTDGSLWAWGGNYEGQLGNGSIIAQDSPRPVYYLNGFMFTEDFIVRVVAPGSVLMIK